MTDLPGVFAAGGVVAPLRLAVRAVAQGHAAAQAIDLFLRGQIPAVPPRPFTTRPGKLEEPELRGMLAGAASVARVEAVGDDMASAVAQASRCLECACSAADTCRFRRWAAAYGARPREFTGWRRHSAADASHEGVVYDPGKCISCGLCVQIARQHAEPLGLAYIGRGFQVRIGVPWSESLAGSLQRAAAECTAACPTGALVRPAAL